MNRTWLYNFLFVLLLGVLGFLILRKHIDHDSAGRMTVSSDVLAFVNAGSDMLAGKDLYYTPTGEKTSYVYPPFYAFLNIPLTFVHPLIVDIGWFCLNIILLAAILRMSYFLYTGTSWSNQKYGRKAGLVVLVLLCSLRYVVRNFQDANVNILILFLVVSSFYWEARNSDVRWAALIGLAGAIKILPLVCVVYYSARKEWSRVGIVIGVGAAALLLPSIVMGIGGNLAALQSFQHYVNGQATPQGVEIENFSLFGFGGRIFSHNQSFLTDNGTPVFCNIASLPLNFITLATGAITLGLVVLLYEITRREQMRERGRSQGTVMILCLLVMNLASILTEDHHLVSFTIVYLFFLVRWKEIHSRVFKAAVVISAIFSTAVSYDVMVPAFGKIFYQYLLSFALPVLPVSLTLLVLVLTVVAGYGLHIHSLGQRDDLVVSSDPG